jgi:hypothetical protein
MGSSFSCAFSARMALLCYCLLGHDQICLQPLNPSVCSSGHNGTAPYPRARANYFNARWASDTIFLSHPDGACGCKCRATPMLHPCHLQGVCLPVDFHVSAQRNFQLDYHLITSMFATAPRSLLLAACYMHSCSQTTVSGWSKASLFDATPIFPRRPMAHNKCSPVIAFVVISSRRRLYHCR